MKITIGILFCLVFIACNPGTPKEPNDWVEDRQSNATNQTTEPLDIVGKKMAVQYGESIYHVSVQTDSTLFWEAMAGGEKGVQADEKYKMMRIADQVLFLSWVEEHDLGVSQVLDFENQKVFTFLKRGNSIDTAIGTVKLIE